MRPWEQVGLAEYTRKEEKYNVITHAAGLILSAGIAACCLIPAIRARDALRIVCASLYLFGTTSMFVTSVLYHAAKPSMRKRTLRLLDYCMIFFAVAGTATGCVPAVYEKVGSGTASLMAAAAWFGALSGLILTFLSFERTKTARMCLYIGTSVICAIIGGRTFKFLPRGALACLFGGGFILLLGSVFCGLGRTRRGFHTIFHVLIDAGLAVFFIGIQEYCY